MSDFLYTVIFKNNSSQPGTAAIYQSAPENSSALAWLNRFAYPTTSVSFQWKIEYGFCWSQTGKLEYGIVVSASQYWPANLTDTNQVTLDYDPQHRAFTFKDQRQGPQPGSLFVTDSATIPANMASVGIGMSGSPTFVTQALPNFNYTFTPHPEYWIAFGNFIQGEVIDIATMGPSAQIDFPPNIYSMMAILNPDNTWTVEPTPIVNTRLVEARAAGRVAAWGEPG